MRGAASRIVVASMLVAAGLVVATHALVGRPLTDPGAAVERAHRGVVPEHGQLLGGRA